MRFITTFQIRGSAVLALVMLLWLAVPARAEEVYSDLIGDGRPDIEEVVVTPGDTVIDLQIVFAAELERTSTLTVEIVDPTNSVPDECSADMADYFVHLGTSLADAPDSYARLVRRTGGDSFTPPVELDHVVTDRSVTITIPRELLAASAGFGLAVTSGDQVAGGVGDRTPDDEGWCYSVAVGGPAVPDTAMQPPGSDWAAILLGILVALTVVEVQRRHPADA